MSKIAVVTDSNSGITQAQAKACGVTVLPMPFYINEELFYEDINLSQEDFYAKLEKRGHFHVPAGGGRCAGSVEQPFKGV